LLWQNASTPQSLAVMQYAPWLQVGAVTVGQEFTTPLHVTRSMPLTTLEEQEPELPLQWRDVPSAHWTLTEQSPRRACSVV
jgi:hypothetical protein